MKKYFYPFLLFCITFLFLIGCESDNSYGNVGDIPFDPEIDRLDFELCNEERILHTYSRYSSNENPRYKGEKIAFKRTILSKFSHRSDQNQTGYITIRFIVNCKGELGRFRIEEMDMNYNNKNFDTNLVSKLMKITKELDGWNPVIIKDRVFDNYQYLTFKIINGQLNEILP